MNLIVDVGNTRIKCALFENNTLLEKFIFLKNEFQNSVEKILENHKNLKNIVVASVGSIDKRDFLVFESRANLFFFSNLANFPFENLYQTPKTAGIDRLVLAAGAVLQFPNKNRLVIDVGTCVTYDFINQKNEYLGGAISPGFRLRYESLHEFTAKLPLLSLEIPENIIGNSTSESIHSGVFFGLINEIDGFIDQYKVQYSNFIIILTGGDTEILAKRLKNTIFANSNFLLESLNRTFQYINQK